MEISKKEYEKIVNDAIETYGWKTSTIKYDLINPHTVNIRVEAASKDGPVFEHSKPFPLSEKRVSGVTLHNHMADEMIKELLLKIK